LLRYRYQAYRRVQVEQVLPALKAETLRRYHSKGA